MIFFWVKLILNKFNKSIYKEKIEDNLKKIIVKGNINLYYILLSFKENLDELSIVPSIGTMLSLNGVLSAVPAVWTYPNNIKVY